MKKIEKWKANFFIAYLVGAIGISKITSGDMHNGMLLIFVAVLCIIMGIIFAMKDKK